MKGKIKVINSTPYLVEDCKLIDENGKQIVKGKSFSLCRCGYSKNKPDCDGSHVKENFIGTCLCKKERREKSYTSPKITVHFDPYLCRHAEECVKGSPDVFKKDDKPWINLNNFNHEILIQTIKKCPSGALSYSINGNRFVNLHSESRVELEKDGPLNIKGIISLENNYNEELYCDSNNHFSLCRCGYSNRKPFCDARHIEKGFKS